MLAHWGPARCQLPPPHTRVLKLCCQCSPTHTHCPQSLFTRLTCEHSPRCGAKARNRSLHPGLPVPRSSFPPPSCTLEQQHTQPLNRGTLHNAAISHPTSTANASAMPHPAARRTNTRPWLQAGTTSHHSLGPGRSQRCRADCNGCWSQPHPSFPSAPFPATASPLPRAHLHGMAGPLGCATSQGRSLGRDAPAPQRLFPSPQPLCSPQPPDPPDTTVTSCGCQQTAPSTTRFKTTQQ